MADYSPKPEHKFTFGLWTVGNIGRDPFGEPTRAPISPVEIVHLLAEVGAWGVNLHDNDLVPIDATAAERDQIVGDFKRAMAETGIVCPMATTNLFADPGLQRRRFHQQRSGRPRLCLAEDDERRWNLGAELGAKVYVFWGGREGAESDSAKMPRRWRQADARCHQLPLRVFEGSGLWLSFRSGAQAERATQRYLFPDCGQHARLHRHARRPRYGRRQPGSGA